ncbi:hypothetical protein SDC9_126813 [bioreactor metagenome]|uniref:Uncharacterized protein n=1 Tax=bioreactor metagenome TaxID=1076179 RepID=A0A645CSV4_9ZZZZ
MESKGFALGESPVYFENLPPKILAGKPFLQFRPESLRLDDDLATPVRLTLYNPTGKPVSGKVRFADEFAEITPAEHAVELQAGERRELELSIRPRKGRCDFRLRPVIAEWNGTKTVVGQAQYFNTAQVKPFEVGNFSETPEVWGKTPDGFRHGNLSGSVAAEKQSGFRLIREPGKPARGEFRAYFEPRPQEGWLGVFFPRKALKLPGIPVTMRMKLRATREMLPTSVGVLMRFRDANGKIFQYMLVPFLSPSDKEEIVMESGIDSPVSQAHRHSQWGGGDPKSFTYPLEFLGFSLNPPPQRVRDTVWDGRIEVKSIEFDCYTPQDPLFPVPQQEDATVQF